MVESISVSTRIVEAVKASILSPIRTVIWAIGKKIVFQVRVFMSMLLGRGTRGSFWMERNTAEEFTTTEVELLLTGNGTKIGSMDLGFTLTLTDRSMKGTG